MESDGKINSFYRGYNKADEINMDLLGKIGAYATRIKKKYWKFVL
jgi:hypothetical protein